MSLRAGAAEAQITPPVGVDLAGYAHREGPSLGVHDELWCRAVVLDDQTTRLAIISLDLLGLDFALDEAIRTTVARGSGLAADHLMLSCSHTHAGPAVAGLRSLGEADSAYVDALPGRVGDVVAAAAARLRPVTASFGTAPVRAGINRRERTADGAITIGRNPEGLADECVRVLSLSDAGGRPAAVLFSHACHGTTVGQENRLLSAEWMGAACARLHGHFDSQAIPIFLQGCCGAINPDREGRSLDEIDLIGARVADAVVAALANARPLRETRLAARLARVNLPLQDPPDPASARAHLDRARDDLENARRRRIHPYQLRALEGLVDYSGEVLALAERGARNLTLPFAVQAVALGELAFVGLSGEVFLDFAHAIEAVSPFPHTVVLGYANGCTGYVPTPEAFAEGGYEAEASFRYYGTLPLAPEAGGEMTAAALRLLRELWRDAACGRVPGPPRP